MQGGGTAHIVNMQGDDNAAVRKKTAKLSLRLGDAWY
ncbi:MAG: hypothetical protein K0Q77_493 [Anaerosporomusa subterranea]|jgi:hypothetical protein|nr:hypothetical protein [Anaerosporomusa subterranea]